MDYSEESFEPKVNIPKDNKTGGGVSTPNPSLKSLEGGSSVSGAAKSEEKSLSGEGLKSAEESTQGLQEGMFKPESFIGKKTGLKNFFWGSRRRKQATAGTGIAGSITGVLISIFFIAAGPAQLIQLSQVLQGDFNGNSNTLSARFNAEISHLNGAPSSIAATRLGTLGQFYLRPLMNKLNAAGITFNENPGGGLQSVDIDPDLVAKADSDFAELTTADEQKAWLSQQFNNKVSPDDITDTVLPDGSKGFTIQAASFDNPYEIPATVSKGIITGATDIPSGPIIGAANARVILKMYDVWTLLHPERLATTAARNAVLSKNQTPLEEADDAESANVDAAIDTPLNSTFQVGELIGSLKNSLNEFSKSTAGTITTGALLGQDAICEAYSSVGSIISFNRLAIVVPSALEATRFIALGDQVKSGQDISAQQVGQAVDSLSNSQGQSVWDAQALQVTENDSNPTGPDLPTSYNQAFSSSTTASSILNVLGAKGFSGVLCSTAGKIISGAIGVALLVAAVPSDGASTATWLTFVGKVGIGAAGTFAALKGIQVLINSTLKDNAVVPQVLSGPLGGNLAAYGAREAANIAAVTNGGVALNNTQEQQVSLETEQQSQKQFASESFFARMFNIDDHRSLFGRIADDIRPSIFANISSFASDILNIGHIFSSSITGVLPKASASSSPYNWGFPEFGTPPGLLNSPDPSLENPYQNAADVVPILNGPSGPSLIAQAETCFGVSINDSSGVWDVNPIANFDVNPQGSDTNGQSYANANCSTDISTTTTNSWDRVVMFVLDTRAMESGTCYMGDANSCSEIGFN